MLFDRSPRPPSRSLLLAALLLLAPAAGAQVGAGNLLNPNLASAEELSSVPGVGPELVEAIVAERPFLDFATLDTVLAASLSAGERESVYRHLFLPLDLNSASRRSILAIPGVGERLAHEFEEYRPYRALAEFRREIGKYVDDDEVARLERYVFVPLDLNSATAAELMTIPGVGERLTHELLEYRPYRAIAEFRREIGKYVDDDELDRLERYLTLG